MHGRIIHLTPVEKSLENLVTEMIDDWQKVSVRVLIWDGLAADQAMTWERWVETPSEQFLRIAHEDDQQGWNGSYIIIFRKNMMISGYGKGLQEAAEDALWSANGCVMLDQAHRGLLNNMMIIGEHTTEHDIRSTFSLLLDPKGKDFITGGAIHLENGNRRFHKPNKNNKAMRVLITGGGGSLGFASAKKFVGEGAEVILVDKCSQELLHERAELLGGCDYYQLDLCDREKLEKLIRDGAFGDRLDVVIFNHGLGSEGMKFPFEQRIEQGMEVNGTSVYHAVMLLLPLLKNAGGASVIITSSHCGIRPEPKLGYYCTPKGAVIGLVRGMANVLAEDQIGIYAYSPGCINNDNMCTYWEEHGREIGKDPEETKEDRIHMIPVHKLGDPESAAEQILYMSQLDATGVLLNASGGESLAR